MWGLRADGSVGLDEATSFLADAGRPRERVNRLQLAAANFPGFDLEETRWRFLGPASVRRTAGELFSGEARTRRDSGVWFRNGMTVRFDLCRPASEPEIRI